MRRRLPFDPRSILVFITSDADNAIGENVLKLPLLLALRSGFPRAHIAWVPGTSGEFYLRDALAPLVGGRIDEFITDLAIPTDPRRSLFHKHPILGRHFDLIVDTQRYLGRTLFLRRIPHARFISGTWRYVFADARPPRPLLRRPPLLIDKLLGLAAAAAGRAVAVDNPIPVPAAFRARAAELLPTGPTYIGLAPGAGNKAKGKCWPLESYIALAQRQQEQGRVPVFLVGPEERQWIAPLREAVPRALFPEQQRPPTGAPRGPCLVAAMAARFAAAVANSSGQGDLLAAGGAPLVSLYGPTRPEKYAPFARSLICLKSQDYGSDRIDAIPLEAVIAAVDRQVAVGAVIGNLSPAQEGNAHAPVGADLGG